MMYEPQEDGTASEVQADEREMTETVNFFLKKMAAIAQKQTEEIKERFCELTAWECKYQSWIDYNIYKWFVKLQTWDYEPTESLRGEALKGFLYDF